jgi:hypothetical protein
MDMHSLVGQRPDSGQDFVDLDSIVEDSTTLVEQHSLDDHVALLIAANSGVGAVLIDRTGHVKLVGPGGADDHGFTLAPGVYELIQSAIDAAEDGDAVYIVAGTYREQLTIRGKQIDLIGATADDGSLLVTLESPDVAKLDVDPVEDSGELSAQCAVIRVRNHAHVTMRHLVIDGRNQGSALGRSNPHLGLASISTADSDTVVEHVETRGFDLTEAVRLLDNSGHLKATFMTIQAAINAADSGDEIVIAAGVYREDLYIIQRVTLSRVNPTSKHPGTDAVIVGKVVVAALAANVVVDGVAIKGKLEMESDAGVTATITFCNSRIDGSGAMGAVGTDPSRPHLRSAV